MSGNAIKSAIVGFGLSGRVFHAPFIHHSSQFDLKTIAQRTSDSSNAEYPYVEAVYSLQEILDDETIELVVVATPNETHFEMALRVLKAGKHLVIEKPFAVNVEETRELINLAESNHLNLFVFHNRRWDGDFLTVQKIIEQKLLGEIVEYEVHYNRFKPELNPKPWKEIKGPGSGILYDLGTHIIDQAVCLFGRPNSVTAHLFKQRAQTKIDDSFDVILEYASLKVSLKSTLLAREEGPRYIIRGRNGSFVKSGIDPQEDDMVAGISPLSENWGIDNKENWGLLNTRLKGLQFQGKVETLRGNYWGFYENIYAVMRESGRIAIPPSSAQTTTEIIESAIASHQFGTKIILE
jgi:scyllo-inositol 2-dehydrogenase (NADP+)